METLSNLSNIYIFKYTAHEKDINFLELVFKEFEGNVRRPGRGASVGGEGAQLIGCTVRRVGYVDVFGVQYSAEG